MYCSIVISSVIYRPFRRNAYGIFPHVLFLSPLLPEYIMRFRPNIDFFVKTLFVSAIRKGVDTRSYHPVDAPSPKHRHCK
jgi:hypothetical protein